MAFITIRKKGDTEPCGVCAGEIEIFGREAAHARFLIVRMADRPFLGGGKCPRCLLYACLSCAATTVYGAGQRRLHCPQCGCLLVGLRREADSDEKWGAFIEEPPEFSGRRAHTDADGVQADAGGVPTDDDES